MFLQASPVIAAFSPTETSTPDPEINLFMNAGTPIRGSLGFAKEAYGSRANLRAVLQLHWVGKWNSGLRPLFFRGRLVVGPVDRKKQG